MSETETQPASNPAEPILANTLNVTRVGGFATIVTGVGAALATLLGEFKDERTAVVIAVIAAITVAIIVQGFITVTDMRVRNRQTIADAYMRVLRARDRLQASPKSNGDGSHLVTPGVSTRVRLIEKEDDPIWQLLAVKVDVDEGKPVTSFLAGNGVEKPDWFKQENIRVLDPS